MTLPILVVVDGAENPRGGRSGGFRPSHHRWLPTPEVRNVKAKLPKGLADTVASKMHAAYRLDSALSAQAALEDLARQLDRSHPGAAGSLREGLEETLTVMRLGVPPTLARTLRSTNPIESMIEISVITARTSNAGVTARWRCAGAQPGCSKPPNSSARSTASCTCPPYAEPSMPRSPR